MFHLLAFQKSQASAATLVALTPAVDQIFPQNSNGQYIMPLNAKLEAATALGATLGQARINTPAFRQVALPDIYPTIIAATPPTAPYIDYKYGYGPVIEKNNPLEVDTTNTNGAGVDQQYAGLWMGDGNYNLPSGKKWTFHATAAITLGNKVWGSGSFTFDQVLPYGTFAIVGMNVVGANLLFARIVFVGGGWRPGVLCNTTYGHFPNPLFRAGALGEYGRFESNAPPQIELFGNAAPTTQEIWLDCIQIA